jgi:hypothetical protein
MKWLRLLNPTRWQICVTVRDVPLSSSEARSIRTRTRYWCGGTPTWALNVLTK